jgi:hypothetical protein
MDLLNLIDILYLVVKVKPAIPIHSIVGMNIAYMSYSGVMKVTI